MQDPTKAKAMSDRALEESKKKLVNKVYGKALFNTKLLTGANFTALAMADDVNAAVVFYKSQHEMKGQAK